MVFPSINDIFGLCSPNHSTLLPFYSINLLALPSTSPSSGFICSCLVCGSIHFLGVPCMSVDEELFMGSWATNQWLHHWESASSPPCSH